VRERAADIGDEGRFRDQVLAAATALPQRKAVLSWPFSRRTTLVLVASMLAVSIAVAVGGSLLNPSPLPSGPPSPLSSTTVDLATNGLIAIGKDEAIMLVDPETGEIAQRLAVPGSPVISISWAPDGNRLAFAIDGAVWVTDIPEGASEEIYGCGTSEGCGGLAWSPDGSRIAVALGHRLVLVDPDGGNEAVLEVFANWAFHPTWSPDSARVAVLVVDIDGTDQRAQLVAVDRNGADVEVVGGPGDDLGGPSWSPDGSTIAYLSGTDVEICYLFPSAETEQCDPGTRLQITTLEVEGSRRRALRAAGECVCLVVGPSLTWSPDGSSLAVVMPDDVVAPGSDEDFALFVVSADGREIRNVLAGHASALAWQPIP
jgi:Tol biopolymer transport system component